LNKPCAAVNVGIPVFCSTASRVGVQAIVGLFEQRTTMPFIQSVLASLVAGALVILLTGLFSRRARWVLTAILGRILGVDIEYVYRNSRAAADDVKHNLERASWVDLMTGRGNELQRETFAPILAERRGPGTRPFRILLPETQPTGAGYDWTAQRESELAKFDRSFGQGVLRTQVNTTVEFLLPHLSEGEIELRLFSYPHLGRILITNRAAFFTPYSAQTHGRDCRVYKYRVGGDMYEFLRRLFEQLWNASRPTANRVSA